MPSRLPETLRLNLLLLLACLASGWLALLLALPPGYVTPLFPPAGIGLAVALVYGVRIIPGLYLAAFLLQWLAHLHSGATSIDLPMLALGGIGAVAQAFGGAWLMRNLRVWPGGLDNARSAIVFVGIITPATCLINTTIAIPVLFSAGASDWSVAFTNWLTWWAGDVLGMLLFLPISLAIIAQPESDWRGRRRNLALPLLIFTQVLAGALTFVRQREEIRITQEFQRKAEHLAGSLQTRLAAQMDMLMAIERFASVSPEFSRTDWMRVTTPWLHRYPGTQNLTWNPLVLNGDRSAYEARMRAEGFTGFLIQDRDSNGRIYPATNAAEYLPITFVEPMESNRRALGLNPASFEVLANAIQRTRSTGHAVATPAIRIVQAPDSRHSVVVYQAVFAQEFNPASPLRGIVSMALQLDHLVSSVRQESRDSGIELCLADHTDISSLQRLIGPPGCSDEAWINNQPILSRSISFADRDWQILLRASDHYLTYQNSWAASATLGTALCFSGMLSAFLLLMTGRTRRIEDQVAERTAELARTSAQLRDQKASLAYAQRIARMGSWEIASGSGHLHCSEEFRRLLELPTAGRILVGDVLARLNLGDRARLDEAIRQTCAAPENTGMDCSIQTEEGPRTLHFKIESEWVTGRLLRVHGTVQDVTAAREAEAHIQHLAHFDPLTGLPNRSYWQELARSALSAARRHHDQAAVLFLDLDHFKNINDSLGHPIGDLLLASVAGRLKHCLRSDDILGRLGGDEFVLLLPRLHGFEEVSSVANKLVQSLSAPLQIQEHELRISVSIGIAYYPGDGEDIDTLLKHADVAMYSAKQAGRNSYRFFVPEMNQRAMQRLQTESALRRAIERDELILHYQPQLDLVTGRINACEALVRWQDPERGMIPPMEFIPLAEESGLILPLGDWVMREACRQQASWAKQGIHLSMAINISALQFQQPDFADKVARVMKETGVMAEEIELEITESALLGFTDSLVASLEQLRALGISLALDDFGTGYSCLAYLKRLPIERLKIDRSFIKDLPGDTEDAAIASATLSMARDLGMDVVAEGVENEAQQAFLIERRCRFIQGYFVSKPMNAAELTPWLRLHNQTAPS